MARVLLAGQAGGEEGLAADLRSWGHEVVVSDSSDPTAVLAAGPDTVLARPDPAGCALARTLRDGRPGLRLVALAARDSEAARREALAGGFDFYLVLPVSPGVLQAIVSPCRPE